MQTSNRRHQSSEIPGKDIKVWLSQISANTQLADIDEWAALLDNHEHERLSRLQKDDAIVRYALGHGLLRHALSEWDPGVAPDRWRFRHTAKGKPEVAGPGAARRPAFSLSYTQGLIACAVSAIGPLGIDVEYVSEDFPYQEILLRTLSQAERSALSALGERAKRERFYEIWTLKEAYLKALGVGLEPELPSLEFAIDQQGRLTPGIRDEGAWQFGVYVPAESYRLSLACSDESQARVTFHRVRSVADPAESFACDPVAHGAATVASDPAD